MNETESNVAQQLAILARRFQEQRTGHAPTAVTVILGEDTLVVNLHDALTPAEKLLAKSPEGAARVQEFHRQLFANSSSEMREEIMRLTGRRVREAAAEIETATGTVVHAFTTGSMVQVFLLNGVAKGESGLERSDGRGLWPLPARQHDSIPPA